jgi:hypothetical protein
MLAVLFLEVSVRMLSVLMYHITHVSMVSNLQFIITSYVEDTKNRKKNIYIHNLNTEGPLSCIFLLRSFCKTFYFVFPNQSL